MPIAYVYDEATGVVMTTASGVLTVEDFLEERKRQRLDDDIPKNTPWSCRLARGRARGCRPGS